MIEMIEGGGVVVEESWTLGHVEEIAMVNFTIMEYEAAPLIANVHKIAYTEFISRPLVTMWDWEMRTQHMFENNGLNIVHDVLALSAGAVNRLRGCGYKTRKEVYDIFSMYHFRLNFWSPDNHWDKANYKF